MRKWASLDVFRGIAVTFMLVNHAAVRWLPEETAAWGIAGTLSFIGSFAPVLFFFATGVGYGLAHQVGRPAKYRDVFIKAGILLLADIFMRGGVFTAIGWDFLGFIAFSMLLLTGFRGRKHGIVGAIVLIFLLLLIRFVLGSAYDKLVSEQSLWIRIALGLSALDGVSYWFTPWFVYPLAGFVIGAWGRKYKEQVDAYTDKTSLAGLVLGLGAAGVSFALLMKGAGLFRWGTMSINFFVASVACVFLSISFALYIADKLRYRALVNKMSMQGVSSLAVVPIHYILLDLIETIHPHPISSILYLVILPFWLILCFTAARETNRLVAHLTRDNSTSLLYGLAAMVAASAIITSTWPTLWWLFVITFAAQYMLCILLGFSYAKR